MHESSPYVSPRLDHSHDRRISDRDDNETEDYPLKFTSSYSLEGTNPSGTADLRLHDNSAENEKYSDKNRDVSEILKDFCGRTSSHGIPHIGSSRSLAGKVFWAVIFLACSVAFITHTYHTIIIYLEYSVILQMQLEFNAAPFPAVTVCNLNPYKMSLISNISMIKEERIFDLANDGTSTSASRRPKRQVYYEPVYARCRCLSPPNKECVPSINEMEHYSTCLCYLDVNSGNIWPCYDEKVWTDHRCANCSTTNACPFPPRRADPLRGEIDEECMCQSISKFCVKRPQGQIQMWEGYKYGVYEPTSEPDYVTDVPMRPLLENLDTKGIETGEIISYATALLDAETRRNLSYLKDEFVLLCSFNGAQCQKERDFRLHDTPRHGNCYTYNFNTSVKLINSRAGPLYGLRLLLNVNQSDYLPHIEGAGVRVVVHHQSQAPFPDTFGYSAPTGAISSFGLKYKSFQRKGYPWSKCTVSQGYDKKNYLFDEEYSTEGCFRSCLQQAIVNRCFCSSHRMPLFRNSSLCNYRNVTHKICVEVTEEMMNKHNNCSCLQPCSEPVYQTSYSAASWPADNFRNIKTEHCTIAQQNNQTCIEYYRKHTAFIEVFYEQLNYEILTEVEAYTIFSLFADFGGNIGLWIGFSTITVVEFLELALELLYHCYYAGSKPLRKRSRTKSVLAAQYINQVAEQSFRDHHKDFTIESSLSSAPENNENKLYSP